jgi:pyruvate dehydrogenase E2 component (dihydrolipoamide acetyltransferase)
MAVKEVLVPDIGDFKDIEVIEVLVKPGDVINTDDSLITLESDKAAMEVPAPFPGVVKSVKVKPGDRVSLGSLILNLEVEEAKAATPAPVQEAAKPVEVSLPTTPVEPTAPAPSVSAVQPSGAPTVQELYVPDIGDYKDIEVIEVLVKPGDEVRADDSLITLESDKAAMEVPSPLSGIIKSISLKTGDRVSKGAVIALIETQTGGVSAAKAPEATAPEAPVSAPVPAPAQAAQPVVSHLSEEAPLDGGLSHASPGIRRLARELGVNLGKVRGTGPKNRILKEDIQQFVKAALAQIEKPTASAGGFGFPPLPEIDFSKYGPIEELPLTRIQKLSGPNLHRNWVSIPHITQYDDADITDLEAFRVSLKSEAEKRGVKLSFLPFVLKAVAASLKAFPTFNASLSQNGESLILKQYVHIGVAVDTPEGLVVPVIRDVDQKSLFDLAQELAELSQKARGKKLRTQDLEGGCFSISSLGGIGGTAFTPIINAPQVAILGLSKNQMKPVYQNGQFVPRLMLPLSLSYDHRVIDGAEAARFIVHLSRVLSDLRRVLL